MVNKVVVQYFAGCIVSLMMFINAFLTVWPSYTIKYFESNQSPLNSPVSAYHINLIGSLPMLTGFISTIFSGKISESIGRKRSAVLCGLTSVLGSALTCTATRIEAILASRCLMGVAGGINVGYYALYLSECCETFRLGSLISLANFGYTCGILVSYVMGWLFSYQFVNYFVLSLSVAYVLLMSWLKETPYYLLRSGKEMEALKSLQFYRGAKSTTKEIVQEMEYIKSLLPGNEQVQDIAPEQEALNQDANIESTVIKKQSLWKLILKTNAIRKPAILVVSLITLMTSMGMIAIQTYAGKLFATAVPNLSPDLCAVALAVANMLGCGVAVLIADLVKRPTLIATSSTLVCISLTVLAVLLKWSIGPDWLIPVVILIYCFCFQVGVACVPFILLSECFHPEIKAVITTVGFCMMWLSNFVNLLVYGLAIELIGLDWTIFVYACIAGFTAALSLLAVPNTSGKTVEEIQKRYQ